ncbi:MAG: TonB-dependent receptor [Pseudomonadales bacterium]|nr:TonB-dependent receptor [Pseudomonadales bacterium]
MQLPNGPRPMLRRAIAIAALSATGNAAATAAPMLEEIVVTAQKRAQSIQDVPIAVTAFDGRMLEDNGAVNIGDLNGIAPNVMIQQQGLVPNTGMFSIRGISFSDPDPNADPKTGVALDGAFLARNNGVLLDMFDIERVEILRGPQGTLFGRNNLAGTINMVSARPTEEFSGKVKGTLGENGQRILRAAVNTGAMADGKVLAKLSASTRNYDGFTKNTFTGNKLDSLESHGARLTVQYQPTDRFDLTVIGDYAAERFNGPGTTNETIDAGGTGRDGDPFKVYHDVDGFSDLDTWGVTIESNLQLDAGVVTLVANHRDLQYLTFGDFDGRVGTTPPPPITFHIGRDAKQDQQSLELRFADEHSDLFDYVVGAYLFREEYQQFNLQSPTTSFANVRTLSRNGQVSESIALFGQTDINIRENLAFVLGGRLTRDDKDFELNTTLQNGTPIRLQSSESWDQATWKVGLNYFVRDGMMTYVSVATGYKGGGYNSRATVAQNIGPYDPEEVISYEAGLKADLLSQRLRVNAAVFTSDYEDIQGAVRRPGGNPTGTESITQSLGDAEVKGVELEMTALATERLTLTANLAFLDAEWTSFLADLTNSGVITDNSFLDLANAPRWSAYGAIDYEQPVPGGLVGWHLDARYMDKHNTWGRDNAPVYYRKAATMLNGAIEFTPDSDRYRLSVYGRNLTDKEIKTGTAFVIHPVTFFEPPREFGIEAQWNF